MRKNAAKKSSQTSPLSAKVPTRRDVIVAVLLMAILGFAAYGNSIHNNFIWDDFHLVKDNICIKNWSGLKDIFTKNIAAGGGSQYYSYRPFQMITYMIDYAVCGLDVRVYHLTNIILHIAAGLAVYWLISLICGDALIALLAAILFITHPVHVAAVTYISGRADPLALLFMALSFILYIKSLKAGKASMLYPAIAVSYILALFSRENSLMLPFLILLYHYVFKERVNSKSFIIVVSLAIAYSILRMTTLGSLMPHVASPTTLWQRLPGVFVALTQYVRLLLLPGGLHMEYGHELFSYPDWRALLGIVILSLLLICAYRSRTRDPIVLFSICWFIIALIPVSNLYPLPIAYMAEHWLYIPSIGYFIIAGKLISYLLKNRGLKVIGACLLVAALSFNMLQTTTYNTLWAHPIRFYENIIRYNPGNERTLNGLAMEYAKIGKKEEAIKLYRRAIAADPNYQDSYLNLGNTYLEMNRLDDAVALYKKSIEMNPNQSAVYTNLGSVYYYSGNAAEAAQWYRKAIEVNPYDVDAYNNLGVAYASLKDYPKAIAAYEESLKLNPDSINARENLKSAREAMEAHAEK